MLTKEQKREIARRIENWSRWYWGSGSEERSPFPAYNLVNIHSPRDSSGNIPVLAGEAEDTDRVLRGMRPEHVKALIMNYLSRGTPKQRAARCKCKKTVYYIRVQRAEIVFNRLCYAKRDQRLAVAA